MHRLAALCAVLLAAILIAGCGPTHTRTITVREHVTTAPPAQAPETSITPNGPGNPSPAKPEAPPVGIALAASLQKTVSANGLRLIEGFEGFGSCPYWDVYGGVWTRGYGETEGIHGSSPCIGRAYGEANLKGRLQRYYEWALRGLHISLNQNQWDALDSFAWNLGAGIFSNTTLGAELRGRQFNAAASNMLQYVHAGGVVLAGLVTRRRAEVRLFLTPVAEASAAQVRSRRLAALRVQQGIRAALHADIERHHCRPGEHNTPRWPISSRLRFHRLCGQWLKRGGAAVRAIRRLRRELHLVVPSARSASFTATASSVEGQILWYGDLSSGSLQKAVYPYWNFVAGHVAVVTDPLGSGRKVLRYAINDSDRPYSGASNPRGDVEGPMMFGPGADAYITDSILIPKGFPLVNHGWWQVDELYGPPHGGSPPIGVYLYDKGGANRLILQRKGGTIEWTGPPLDGRWHRVTLHVHFSTGTSGSLQVFYDGAGQQLANGTATVSYPNLVWSVNWDGSHPNFLNINSYRQAGAFPGTVTLYHGAPTVATTLAASLSKPNP